MNMRTVLKQMVERYGLKQWYSTGGTRRHLRGYV